jgi:hypothetical protein
MATPKAAGFDPGKLCALDEFIGRQTGATIHRVVEVGSAARLKTQIRSARALRYPP